MTVKRVVIREYKRVLRNFTEQIFRRIPQRIAFNLESPQKLVKGGNYTEVICRFFDRLNLETRVSLLTKDLD